MLFTVTQLYIAKFPSKTQCGWVVGFFWLAGLGSGFFILFFFLREQTSECYILLKRTAHKRIANTLHSRCLPCYKQCNAGKCLSNNIHTKHHK